MVHPTVLSVFLLLAHLIPSILAFNTVFSKHEVESCGKLRSPVLVKFQDGFYVYAECRGVSQGNEELVGDDFTHCRIVGKSSSDFGKSWGNFTYFTGTGYGGNVAVHDHVRDRILLSYNRHPSPHPSVNVTTYLQWSHDGSSWHSRIDIQSQLKDCNRLGDSQMMVWSAGTQTQLANGRILIPAHDHDNNVCVYRSDDGGSTWHGTLQHGGETSVAEVDPSHGSVLLNGRSAHFGWKPHRTDYFSTDHGKSFPKAQESPLMDDTDFGCEGALISVPNHGGQNAPNTLYFCEPAQKDRKQMMVHCSKDGGKSWKKSYELTSSKTRGGYSYMVYDDKGTELVVVWEDGESGNVNVETISTKWCS